MTTLTLDSFATSRNVGYAIACADRSIHWVLYGYRTIATGSDIPVKHVSIPWSSVGDGVKTAIDKEFASRGLKPYYATSRING